MAAIWLYFWTSQNLSNTYSQHYLRASFLSQWPSDGVYMSGLYYYRKKLCPIAHYITFAFAIRYFFFQRCLFMALPRNTDTRLRYVEAYRFAISLVTVFKLTVRREPRTRFIYSISGCSCEEYGEKIEGRSIGSMKKVWKENGERKRLWVHVKRKKMSQAE